MRKCVSRTLVSRWGLGGRMLIGREVRIGVGIACAAHDQRNGKEVSKSDQVVPIRTSCHT